jgi:sugar transferase (PEP-CTERM/EpsH1 system associated)
VKILWVKSGGFLPLDTGGKIRSYSLLRELARRHHVSVFTFYPEQEEDRHGQLRDFCKEVFLQPLSLPPRASFSDLLAYARNIPRPLPYPMVKYCRPEVKAHLARTLAAQNYDIIVCDYLLTAAVIPWEVDCPKVIFTHNIEAVIWERHWRVSRNPLWKLMSWREYRTMARVERLYLSKADHVLTVSDSDREFFSKTVAPEKITTIPTGVDVGYFQESSTNSGEPDTLVFSGSMDWLPNEDAMLHFADKILPLIRERAAGVKLIVVGRQPTSQVRALEARHPNIVVTGTVADIRPYLRKACVYVVPLRIGGGTRIKIFEAMAMGKAVVSTSIGAEGLPVTSGKNIVIADAPETFAAAVLRLLGNPGERQDVGRAARELVERQYGWPAVTDIFESSLLNSARERQAELASREVLV